MYASSPTLGAAAVSGGVLAVTGGNTVAALIALGATGVILGGLILMRERLMKRHELNESPAAS